MKPTVLYGAKSTTDVRGSIPDQLADGRALAAQRGLEVVAEFQDEAASAYHGNRGPGLAAAMARCEQLGKSTLIVQHSDRLARGDAKEARHLIEVVLWAIKHDVELLSVQDPEILAGGDLALLLGAIGGMRNHQDSKRKSQAVKDGLRRRAVQRGMLAGGPRPYGYRWVGEERKKLLVVVPAEAVVVRRIFEDTINGVSQRSLAGRLTSEGVPTTTGVRWAQPTVGTILSNPLYKGYVRHGARSSADGKDEVFPGIHEAIVSEELWDRAAAVRSSKPRRKGGRWPKGSHLLTGGLLRCGQCGSAMTPRRELSGQQVYACTTRRGLGADFCAQPAVRRELVDESILAELTSRWIDLDETRRRIEERHSADLTVARSNQSDSEREVARKQESLARVERDYLDGKLPADDWTRFKAQLTDELDGARNALERAQEHVEAIEHVGALAGGEQALLDRLAALKSAVAQGVDAAPDLNALRTMLRTLFKEIMLVSHDNPKAILVLGGAGGASAGHYWLIPRAHRSELYAALTAGLPTLPLHQTDKESSAFL